jgi:murein L,D-transpeptidase YcbB/YkuD
LGDHGPAVVILQHFLLTVVSRPNQSWLEEADAFGTFGNATKVEVLAFQRRWGLKADGIVGPITWGELADQLRGELRDALGL